MSHKAEEPAGDNGELLRKGGNGHEPAQWTIALENLQAHKANKQKQERRQFYDPRN